MHKRVGLALGVILFLVSCRLPPGFFVPQTEIASSLGPADSPASSGVEPEQLVGVVTALLVEANQARLAVDQPPMVANANLVEAAQLRAEDMAETGYFNHVHPLRGTAEIERLLRPKVPEGKIAELLFLDDCAWEEVAELAVATWLQDEANRAVLIDGSYEFMGAGIEAGSEGLYTVLVISEDR